MVGGGGRGDGSEGEEGGVGQWERREHARSKIAVRRREGEGGTCVGRQLSVQRNN